MKARELIEDALATIVLSVAKRGVLEPKQLADEALKLMSANPTQLP